MISVYTNFVASQLVVVRMCQSGPQTMFAVANYVRELPSHDAQLKQFNFQI